MIIRFVSSAVRFYPYPLYPCSFYLYMKPWSKRYSQQNYQYLQNNLQHLYIHIRGRRSSWPDGTIMNQVGPTVSHTSKAGHETTSLRLGEKATFSYSWSIKRFYGRRKKKIYIFIYGIIIAYSLLHNAKW